MLNVSDARTRILAIFEPVETANLSIAHLTGRVLAGDITSKTDFPLFDNSSVDGFALQTSDIVGALHAAPHTLQVTADIRAGTFSDIPIRSGQCARIMTGAPLPPGADAVVMVEDTDFNKRFAGSLAPQTVAVYKPLQPG
jgi:molybdopterin molybdotransferase